MSESFEERVFKHANATLYYSNRLLPRAIRRDVLKLYGFARVAQDYVALVPARPDHLQELESLWLRIRENPHEARKLRAQDDPNQLVIRDLADLVERYTLEPAWIDSFFASLHMDLYNRRFESLDDSLQYMYGASEVFGMVIAKLLRLHPDSYESARLHARAIQYLNFMLHIADDASVGRMRFPTDELRTFGLSDLSPNTTYKYPVAFKDFIALQVGRYKEWRSAADDGLRFVKRRERFPIRTALDLHDQQMLKIEANPFIVYDPREKLEKWRVYQQGIYRLYYG